MHFPPRCIYDVSLFLFLLYMQDVFPPIILRWRCRRDEIRQSATALHLKQRLHTQIPIYRRTFVRAHFCSWPLHFLRSPCHSTRFLPNGCLVLVVTVSFSVLKIQLISKTESFTWNIKKSPQSWEMNTMQCKFIRLIREPGENFRQACTCSTYVLAVTVYNAVDGSL